MLQALAGNGGSLIDTASTYGDAESVLGDVMAPAGLRDKLFIATKCEAPDAAEVKRSLARLQTTKLDLLQLHNVIRLKTGTKRCLLVRLPIHDHSKLRAGITGEF